MISGTMIAEIAALAGDPARANILTALLDGRAMTATELSFAARVTPQTASAHLAKLVEAGLITATPSGRHRSFRLSSAKIAQMLESIGAVALDSRPRFRPLSRQAAALRDARVCYDHLAGRLGVMLADALSEQQHIEFSDDGGVVTPSGEAFFTKFGIDLGASRKNRRVFCRPCVDWSERRPHLAGAVGAALADRLIHLNWIKRKRDTRAITITPIGWANIERTFSCSLHDHTVHKRPELRVAG